MMIIPAPLTAVLALGLLAAPVVAEAQQERKIARIGALMTGVPSAARPYIEGFGQGLRQLGYREGENITVEYRYVEGKVDQLRDAAAALVRAKVDVIVAWGTPAVIAAKQTTSTVPIIFVAVGDPVGTGLIASLARPGGNITGLTNMSAELSAKQLALLREVVPGLTRVAVLRNPTNPVSAPQLIWTQVAAPPLRVQLQVIDVHDPQGLEAAFSEMTREKAGAVTVLADPMFLSQRARIADLAVKSRLPTTFNWGQYAEAGGLIAYGPSLAELWRRTATFVDKILKDARPAELPVEQPTKFELVINLKTAKALGLTIPPSLLLRADQVIE
ncbi:MAG: ABC transporter substrate-binding protein [Candidatus Rokubacteria bacterium]|nr:ABC transporter substrate-binding protein [Candidatus Rokubacteria bacterium]